MRSWTVASIALVAAGCASRGAVRLAPLPFIENDYPRALAQAKQRHVPLFVDAWAPW